MRMHTRLASPPRDKGHAGVTHWVPTGLWPATVGWLAHGMPSHISSIHVMINGMIRQPAPSPDSPQSNLLFFFFAICTSSTEYQHGVPRSTVNSQSTTT